MKRKILTISTVVATILMSGCGGGDDSSTDNSVVTGTAYYLDSAVAGVNYKCGTQEGVTDASGKFVFEEGQNCSFYIGDVKLKDMDLAELVDGAKIVESDVKVATLLQSLDADGNASNGIAITPDVVAFISDTFDATDDFSLPTIVDSAVDGFDLVTLVDDLKTHVDDFKGNVVTEEEAQNHLNATKLEIQTEKTEALLAGKTFYAYGEMDGNPYLSKVEFNADASSFVETNLETQDSSVNNIDIEGDRWYSVNDSDGSYTIVSIADGYIFFDDRNADGSKDGIGHRLYNTLSDAQAYYDSVIGTNPTEFTQSYLDGKTLYWVTFDDFGYDDIGVKWNMARMTFSDTTVEFQEYDTPDSDTHQFDYSVTDGSLKVNEEHFDTYTIVSSTDDYLYVKEGDNEYGYMFFDEAKAKAFRDAQNGENTTSSATALFTTSLLSTNPWYVLEYTDTDLYCNGKFTFDDNYNISVEYNEDGEAEIYRGTYQIEDGLLVTQHDGKIEKETLLSASTDSLYSEKYAYGEDTGELINVMDKVYFLSYDAMLDFADKRGVDCRSSIPK